MFFFFIFSSTELCNVGRGVCSNYTLCVPAYLSVRGRLCARCWIELLIPRPLLPTPQPRGKTSIFTWPTPVARPETLRRSEMCQGSNGRPDSRPFLYEWRRHRIFFYISLSLRTFVSFIPLLFYKLTLLSHRQTRLCFLKSSVQCTRYLSHINVHGRLWWGTSAQYIEKLNLIVQSSFTVNIL